MNLTKEQRFYITLNNKIKNKRFENYYNALKKLNQLLENGTLSYENYWTLTARANKVYNKGGIDYVKLQRRKFKF